ncbi:hypothetical protein BDZ91DRAFT_723123 [Kalaharituber pfeilii]|nr:hypothetical protein BDZ91DRAFT_723123 [Kalaharituber pfeilii]
MAIAAYANFGASKPVGKPCNFIYAKTCHTHLVSTLGFQGFCALLMRNPFHSMRKYIKIARVCVLFLLAIMTLSGTVVWRRPKLGQPRKENKKNSLQLSCLV